MEGQGQANGEEVRKQECEPCLRKAAQLSNRNVVDNVLRDSRHTLDGVPEPPDGGWGWVIAIASFLCNTVVDGISYSFGILLVDLIRYYKSQKGETAWIGSLLSGMFIGSGIVVGPLTNRFGCRPVAMTGSVIAAAAFLISTAAPNVKVLLFTYGIMGGLGFGMIYLPSVVSVGYYFSTKRALATGLATCGSGMGAFVFAPLTQSLLEMYDWKGALTVIAGLALNCMVFGAVMRPLERKGCPKRKTTVDRTSGAASDRKECHPLLDTADRLAPKSPSNTEPGVHSTLSVDRVGVPHLHKTEKSGGDINSQTAVRSTENGLRGDPQLPLSSVHNGVPAHGSSSKAMLSTKQLETNGTFSVCRSQITMQDYEGNICLSTAMRGSANVLCPTDTNSNYAVQESSFGAISPKSQPRKRSVETRDLTRPLYRKDIFYSGNIMHLPEFRESRHDVRAYVANVTAVPSDVTSSAEKKRCPAVLRIPKSIVDAVRMNLDYSLFRQLPFFLTCLANAFGMMGFYIVWVYLADSSIGKGIDEERASFLISMMGIANLIGKIVFGWIVDRPKIRSLDMNNLCLVVSGLAAASVPFFNSYSAIAGAVIIFSIFSGAYISLISIVLVDMVGLDKLTNSFGMLSLFRGIGSIIGPPIAGTVFDVTDSYDVPFYLSGAFLLTSAAFTFVVPCLSKSRKEEAQAPNSAKSSHLNNSVLQGTKKNPSSNLV